MDATLYKRLVDCNAEKSWSHVRDIVAVQLMGAEVFPVPDLIDSVNFDVGCVVLKSKPKKLEKLTGVSSSALPAGKLSTFVQDDPEHNLMQRLGKRRKDTDSSLNQAYEFLESDMKHGVKKTILVQLWGCEKWALDYIPKSRDIKINLAKKGFSNFDRIFLISEVHYVTEVKISVTIGDKSDEYMLKGHIPIGFSLLRYKLTPDGYLGEQKRKKPSKWHARWIKCQVRHSQDALPLNPYVDDVRTSHGGIVTTRDTFVLRVACIDLAQVTKK